MDPELAFLMTNMALVGPGSIVLDPFVGTGNKKILQTFSYTGNYSTGVST